MSISPNHEDPSVTNPDSLIGPAFHEAQKSTIKASAHRNWSIASALGLITLALPLLLFPRILSLIFGSLLASTVSPLAGAAPLPLAGGAGVEAAQAGIQAGAGAIIRELNVLERSLAGVTGLSLLSLAGVLIIQTGVIPFASNSSIALDDTNPAAHDGPFRTPTIIIVTGFFTALSYFSYDLGLWVITAFSGALGIWGAGVILFATSTRVNKIGKGKLGGTSSFPFKNENVEGLKTAQSKKDL